MRLRPTASAALLGLVTLPAFAAITPIYFDFRKPACLTPEAGSFQTCSSTDRCATSFGGALQFSAPGAKVDVSGRYYTGNTVNGTPEIKDAVAVQDADSGGLPAGLGVYKPSSISKKNGSWSVSNTADDNVSQGEILTLRFNRLVRIDAITFRNGDHGTTFLNNGKPTGFGFASGAEIMAQQELKNIFLPASDSIGGANFTNTEFSFYGLGTSLGSGLFADQENSKFYISSITVTPVPEPASAMMLLGGLGAVAAARWRRRKVAA